MQESRDGRESPDQRGWEMKLRTKCRATRAPYVHVFDGAVELKRHSSTRLATLLMAAVPQGEHGAAVSLNYLCATATARPVMLRFSQVIEAKRSAGDTNAGIVECGETVEESRSGVKGRLHRR